VERLIGQHQAVVDWIAANDPDRAEAAMREHLREILISLPELAEQFPEFFERDLTHQASPPVTAGGGKDGMLFQK
jgi:hypothetical protein